MRADGIMEFLRDAQGGEVLGVVVELLDDVSGSGFHAQIRNFILDKEITGAGRQGETVIDVGDAVMQTIHPAIAEKAVGEEDVVLDGAVQRLRGLSGFAAARQLRFPLPNLPSRG